MSDVIDFLSRAGDPDVIETPTHARIVDILEDCHANMRLGVIRGGFGIGKTFTLARYAAVHDDGVAMVTLSSALRSMTAGLSELRRSVEALRQRYTGLIGDPWNSSYNAAHRHAIERQCLEHTDESGAHPLLIVDEAQHARPDLLDAFRDLYDAGCCGLVIAGNQALFNPRRGRMEAADFGALLSRARHVLDVPAATAGDVDAVLDAYRIAGRESRLLLAEIAAAGGLREAINAIEKARELSGSPLVAYRHVKAAAATTGLSAIGWDRRR